MKPCENAIRYSSPFDGVFLAVVVDRRWNVLQANKGAVVLVEFLVGPLAPGAALNLADALVAPHVLRPHLVNWAEVVRHFVRTVEADAAADGTAATNELLQRLLGYEGVPELMSGTVPPEDATPVLPMHFRKDSANIRLFTTIATLGTPQDITLQELRIESFFPMDDETRDLFRKWGSCDGRS